MSELDHAVAEFEAVYARMRQLRARLDAVENENAEHRRTLGRRPYRLLASFLRKIGR